MRGVLRGRNYYTIKRTILSVGPRLRYTGGGAGADTVTLFRHNFTLSILRYARSAISVANDADTPTFEA